MKKVLILAAILFAVPTALASGSEKVTLCHKPDNQAITLEVGDPAVDAHLAHGDTLGACGEEEPPGGGGGGGGGIVVTPLPGGPNTAMVYCDFDHYVVVGVVDGQVADSAVPSTIPGTYRGWTNITLWRGDTDWRSAVFTYGDCVPR